MKDLTPWKGPKPMERTHTGTGHEELQPVGGIRVRQVHRGLSPVEETPHWGRGCVRSAPPEEEAAAETPHKETTIAPIPEAPLLLGGKWYRKPRVKLSPGRREG